MLIPPCNKALLDVKGTVRSRMSEMPEADGLDSCRCMICVVSAGA